jgi:hypothetical protein
LLHGKSKNLALLRLLCGMQSPGVEGCGHMLKLEAPARVKAVLRAMAKGDQRPRR